MCGVRLMKTWKCKCIAVKRGVSVRHLQQKCKLSQLQTDCIIKMMQKFGLGNVDLRSADRKMHSESGVEMIVLHGCVHVDEDDNVCQHVFGPQDKRTRCPKCNHPRYKANGREPNEVVYWFPLKSRLKALMELPTYARLLQVFYLCFISILS